MKLSNNFLFLIFLIKISFELSFPFLNSPSVTKVNQLNAVYRIDSLDNNYSLKMEKNNLNFVKSKEGKEELFRIVSIKDNIHYIIFRPSNKYLGINDKGEILLYNKDNINDLTEKIKWNFISINQDEFILQNLHNKKYLEMKVKKDRSKNIYYPMCSSDININKIENIGKIFKFYFFKICEEVHLKPEHIPIIENEPIDILIKYIDLTDTNLKREGIKQIKKDYDNEELRYCVRSILQYIPWIRKIFILMPNEKVKYFKPLEEISNKIVYVKDKDMLGFDSANSVAFQLNLYNMKKFGISENFILIDDDYFFGKPIKKTEFFYYDEEQKKVFPSVVTDDPCQLIKNDVLEQYNKLYRRKSSINPHSFNGWKISQLAVYKLIAENYKQPLIIGGFTHCAIPIYLEDLKEIHDLIVNKYQYSKEVLSSKIRTVYDLQPQSFFNTYGIAIKKRKLNTIPYAYYDIAFLNKANFNIELFVMNTSGDRSYTQEMNDKVTSILKNKYSIPTPFEIEDNKIETSKNFDISNYIKKEEYSNLKKEYENLNKNNEELKRKNKEIIDEKKKIENINKEKEKILQNEINRLIKEIKEKNITNISINYTINNTSDNNNINIKKYIFFKNYFNVSIVFLLFLLMVCILVERYRIKYYSNNKDIKSNNILQLSEIINKDESKEAFNRLPSDENNI